MPDMLNTLSGGALTNLVATMENLTRVAGSIEQAIVAASTAPVKPYDFLAFMGDGVLSNGQFYRFVVVRGVTLRATLPQSSGFATAAATGSSTFTLNKISGGVTTAIGSANFAIGLATATFTFASDVTFAAGDMIEIVGPNPADGTLAGVAFGLAGALA